MLGGFKSKDSHSEVQSPSTRRHKHRPKKLGMKKAVVYVKKISTVSRMAQVLRASLAMAISRQVSSGDVQSIYLTKFIVCDIVSPKCWVVMPHKEIAVGSEGQPRKLLFKVLNTETINMYCNTDKPKESQVSRIIDQWVYLTPKTPNIVTAYEVFKDMKYFLQMTEFCEGFDNVYAHIKAQQLNILTGVSIPRKLIKMVYLYTIQISSAFAIAHNSNLTHGLYDLTQCICDEELMIYKIVNFRPWLAQGKRYDRLDEMGLSQSTLTAEDKMKIAKSRDLFDFGISVYELMIAKTSKAETVAQKQFGGEKRLKSPPNSNESRGEIAAPIIPLLDSLPLNWVKLAESAALLEIIHLSMLVDTSRDTVGLFERINQLATEQYQRFFDPSFKPLPSIRECSSELRCIFLSVGLNNRAVISTFKVMTQTLNKRVSSVENQRILDFQQKLLEMAVTANPHNQEGQYNLILLLWKQGKIMDYQACRLLKKRIQHKLTAQLVILLFRTAIGLQVDRSQVQAVISQAAQKVMKTRDFFGISNTNLFDFNDENTALKKDLDTTLSPLALKVYDKLCEIHLVETILSSPFKSETIGSKALVTPRTDFCDVEAGFHNLATHITKVIPAAIEKVGEHKLQKKDSVSFKPQINIVKSCLNLALLPTELQRQHSGLNVEQQLDRQIAFETAREEFGIIFDKVTAFATEKQPAPGAFTPSMRIKKMFFSKNERFIVLITDNQAIVLQLDADGFKIFGSVKLPQLKSIPSHYRESKLQNQKSESSFKNSQLSSVKGEESGRNEFKYWQKDKSVEELESDEDLNGSVKKRKESFKKADFKAEKSIARKSQQSLDESGNADTSGDKTGKRGFVAPDPMTEETVEEESSENLAAKSGGFFISPWLAAIDNTGKNLVLHSADSVVQAPKFTEMHELGWQIAASMARRKHNNKAVLNQTDESTISEEPIPGGNANQSRVYSNLLVFHLADEGDNEFMFSGKVPIGHLCPDEILEIVFGHQELSKVESKTPKTSDRAKEELSKLPLQTEPSTRKVNLQHPELQEVNESYDSTIKLLSSPRSVPQIFDNKANTNQEFLLLEVRCKNLKKYDLDLTDVITVCEAENELSFFPQAYLHSEPRTLSGGANLPVGLFRLAANTKRKAARTFHANSAVNEDFFEKNQPEVSDPSFNTQHFEFMRQFIQKHELLGNVVRLSQFHANHVVVYQSKPFSDRRPHFFVYDIFARKVTRRFYPLNKDFQLQWSKKTKQLVSMAVAETHSLTSGTEEELTPRSYSSRSESISSVSAASVQKVTAREVQAMIEKQEAVPIPVEVEVESSDEGEEDIPVNNFEISPLGSYMVSVVDNTQLVLEFLPQGYHEALMQSIEPVFMADEFQSKVFCQTHEDEVDQAEVISKADTQKLTEDSKKPVQSEEERQRQQQMAVARKAYIDNQYLMEKDNMHISDALSDIFTQFQNFKGSTHGKHILLVEWHNQVARALDAPIELIFYNQKSVSKEIGTTESGGQSGDISVDERRDLKNQKMVPIHIFKKCIEAIQEYHYFYSIHTDPIKLLTSPKPNAHSKKVGVLALHKIFVFDQIAFGRAEDEIAHFLLCSSPENWYFAVFFRRQLQVYDQITGEQIFELKCGSAKGMRFMDNENLIIIQEGTSSLYICAVQAQRKTFSERIKQQKKIEAVMTHEYEENQKVSDYAIGLRAQRQKRRDNDSDHEDQEDYEDAAAVKIIKFDEDIIRVFCAKNAAPFGYIGILGTTKLSIFIAFAEEESCSYSHVWTLNFLTYRKQDLGRSIELIDFSSECDTFVAYFNSGTIAKFHIQKQMLVNVLYMTDFKTEAPLCDIRSICNSSKVVGYSRVHEKILIIDADALVENPLKDRNQFVKVISPASLGLGKVVKFQVDNTDQFLVCACDTNKVVVFSLETGNVVLQSSDSQLRVNTANNVFIDETCCFVATLDENKKLAHIYVLQWLWQVNDPPLIKKIEQESFEEEMAERKKLADEKKSKFCTVF